MKLHAPPGVFDILPVDPQEPWKSAYLWAFVESIIRETARQFGYQEIRTPILERTELFQRGVGTGTDIVSKEMYTFEDRGNRSLTLRPEGTAPVIRAYIEHGLYHTASQSKLFYIAPMFRYERSQAGRYRQHHQFGAEALGIRSAEQDVEIIDLLYTVYSRLGLSNLTVVINSIGDKECRERYREALRDFLAESFQHLSTDSQSRFDQNPLRILDSKDQMDQTLLKDAPSILDFLSEDSLAHFEKVQEKLNDLQIPFLINSKIVRGLDYYNDIVFEVTSSELGAQNSIGGGGRYDQLVEQLGGPKTPAIGFGTGIERIIQALLAQKCPTPLPPVPFIYFIPLGEKGKNLAFKLTHLLRSEHIPASSDFTEKKLGKAMQIANQIGARYVAVVGDHEVESGEIELKEMATGKKQTLLLEKESKKLIKQFKEIDTLYA